MTARSTDHPSKPAPLSRRPPDPAHGSFTLAQATEGLAGTGALTAEIETSLGTFTCTLAEREAPITVANFVGLARGRRPFWDPGRGRLGDAAPSTTARSSTG
jgi:peptidyl-prolyl cis-trans isomerase A (cyclophilin A)